MSCYYFIKHERKLSQAKAMVTIMKVEQFVMAYGVEQDRLRAMLPAGFISLRPVLRINAEVLGDTATYVEFNTPVERDGVRGWLNIGLWKDMEFKKCGKTTSFVCDFLEISFTKVNITGGCPAEKDNAGCFYIDAAALSHAQKTAIRLQPPEAITANKEFCDCAFKWKFTDADAHGKSTGKTLPAYPTEAKNNYPQAPFTPAIAANIPCEQVLGAYAVEFER